jgi:hypothetical protein
MNNQANLQRFLGFLALGGLLGIAALGPSCTNEGPSAPNETNFWGPCQTDADCPEDFLCNDSNMCMEREDSSPYPCGGDCGAASAAPYGEVIATYRGVPAYSNGSTFGCHPCADGALLGLGCGYRCDGFYSPETPYGIAYQCIEYVRRFYAEVYGDKAIGDSRGNANSYVGTKAVLLGLTEHVNGQTSVLPRPDDILVFFGGEAGHIAIVTQVETETQRVWFIQQNVPGAGEMSTTYQLVNGQVKLDKAGSLSNLTIHSWLRNPQYDLPCNDNLPCPEDYTCTGGSCQEANCPMPAEASGVVVAPADGSQQSGDFLASGNISDDNGIAKVTVTVDTLQDCKFSEFPPDPTTANFTFGITVSPESCGLAPGVHTLGLWMEDGCGIASLVDSIEFNYVEDQPGDCVAGSVCCEPSGTFTPLGANGPQCFGECNACDGAGGCDAHSPGTSCANGQGTCDGAGVCEVATCGDGNQTVDPGEQCDGNNLDGENCVSLGFDGGTLNCTSDCTFNTAGCTEDPGCQEITHWDPALIDDLDPSGTQYLNGSPVPLASTGIRLEIEDAGAGQLQIRACKVENPPSNFQNSVRVYFVNDDNVVMFDQTLAPAGQCTNYGQMSNENGYSEGMALAGQWRVVSPSTSASEWTYTCTKALGNDPTGTCWWDSSIPAMQRTCM